MEIEVFYCNSLDKTSEAGTSAKEHLAPIPLIYSVHLVKPKSFLGVGTSSNLHLDGKTNNTHPEEHRPFSQANTWTSTVLLKLNFTCH